MLFKFVSNIIDNPDPVIVTPYGGYASQTMLHAFGRVLEDEGVDIREETSVITNIWHSFKRFESDEHHNARVIVSWEGKKKELRSDEEGYIRLEVPHKHPMKHRETLWIPLTYSLMKGQEVIFETTDQVMKPSPQAEYGIISDMDDTILQTGVDSTLKWRVLVNSLARNSHRRLPMQGAGKFYQALQKGTTGYGSNPVFYVSNSPWNIHDYLTAFLTKNNFPKGPLMLRDIGPENKRPESYTEGSKFKRIQHILRTYPSLPFVLIGDAGELDADIYMKIALEFPEQVRSIYIRTVRRRRRNERVEELIEKTTHADVFLFTSTTEVQKHALERGLISR